MSKPGKIVKHTSEELKAMRLEDKDLTDWDRVANMKDEDIVFDEDAPELDEEFFRNAELRLPSRKPIVTMRLDPDVLAWFKAQGKGYQTRINAVLRAYMEAHKR